ncbi:methionine adenosyltransferase [Pseudogulbenkiania sp. MAI-1]|uniref:methionine adenosyltransferase n=1 Tax=Pseudogulbenkiania sp. MAI-1 TaxID=990370 RepID=UPI00045E89DE|nr:methionine adenosyltransferase [Pseudogulbenkiania sp. MAI-1]
MSDGCCIVSALPASSWMLPTEMCEHKGIGHPDSLCDGAVEAAARALGRAYLENYGAIRPFNLDKALLIGGVSKPRFGGGRLLQPMRLIISGPVTELPSPSAREVVEQAVRTYIDSTIGLDPAAIVIEPRVRTCTPSLAHVLDMPAGVLSNDTSFGVGYAPHSELERLVLDAAAVLRSDALRTQIPGAGKDFKVMGSRHGNKLSLTVALAILDCEVGDAGMYFAIKERVGSFLHERLDEHFSLRINTLDNPDATDEGSIYLTVTGLSAEQGDDGQVGRGNRVNGLITPYRPMSLEAAAGKNPAAHVGKLYNVLAHKLARDIYEHVAGLNGVTVRLLSTIGMPVDQPHLAAVDVATSAPLGQAQRAWIKKLVAAGLDDLPALSRQLIDGDIPVF